MPKNTLFDTAIALLVFLIAACSDDTRHGSADASTDADADADTDSDVDTDTDSDSDADAGGDTDTNPALVESCSNGWCEIPSGTFTFGSPESEPCRDPYSDEQFEVTLTRPFLIQQTEVTQVQWEAAGFPNPSKGTIAADVPVFFVSYFDAMAYANFLSESEGLDTCYDLSACTGTIGGGCPEGYDYGCSDDPPGAMPDLFNCGGDVHKYADWYACPGYRLPTSAEWEYAARAGATGSTYNGEITTQNEDGCDDAVADTVMWYCGNAATPQPVGGKLKNAWGLYDVLGNVQEWTDYVFKGLNISTTVGQEPPIVDPIGDGVGDVRDIRGGSYRDVACYSRLGSQRGAPPEARGNDHGIRLARTLDASTEADAGMSEEMCVWR